MTMNRGPDGIVASRQRWSLPAALAKRLNDFESRPSLTLHAERQGLADEIAGAVLLSVGHTSPVIWHRHRSHALLSQMGLPTLAVPDMTVQVSKLVLLDGRELGALADLCGVVLLAPSIRAVIARAAVHMLIERVGAPLYRFAMTNAPRWHAGLPHGVELPDEAAPPHGAAPPPGAAAPPGAARPQGAALPAEVLVRALDEMGWRLLVRAVEDSPEAVKARFALKTPPASGQPPEAPLHALQRQLGAAFPRPRDALDLVALLISHLNFPWHSSFNALASSQPA